MASWSARARLTWAAVVLLAGIAGTTTFVWPGPLAASPSDGAWDWVILASLILLAAYLALRPIQTAPDRRITAASAPVIALALLFEPSTAILAGLTASALCQLIRRAPWHVSVFNAGQRTVAIATAAGTCAALQALPGLPFFVPCAASAVTFFVANTVAVSAMSAARKDLAWPAVWACMVREQIVGESALLVGGALVAIHIHSAPLAVPLLVPPLWLAWRVLAGAAEIRRLNASLQGALEHQQRFLADASHELRTPIASLRAQLETLRRQVGAAPAVEIRERLDEALTETARVGTLLADLLALARSDSGVPLTRERVNLEDVLLDVYRELRPLAERVSLSVHLDDEAALPPMVLGDRERLRQLGLNLAANAVRFTPAGGSVEIRCGASGDRVSIEVADTGSGIAPQDLPRIFDRFYRAERGRARDGESAGSGLGLSIVKWIVEAHCGSIDVQSTLGQGTRVTVSLPAAPADPVPFRTAARAATAEAR